MPQPVDLPGFADIASALPKTAKDEPQEDQAETPPRPPRRTGEAARIELEALEAKDLEQAEEEATLNGIGELATLRRFLRIWEAREAWDRRLLRELLSWSVGQPVTQLPVHEEDFYASQGTPAWARPSGALFRAAAATCSSSHILASSSKPKQSKPRPKKPRKPGEPEAESSSEESSESEEPRPYRQNDWPEETRQFEILRGLWPKYLRFREARALQERPRPDWKMASLESVERELSLRSWLGQAGGGFQKSEWHGLLCRLLLCLHNNAELFLHVQLPFMKRQFLGLPALPALDLWQQTRRFLRMSSGRHSRPEEVNAWVEALRKSSMSLVSAAPKLWRCIFANKSPCNSRKLLEEEVRHALAASDGLDHLDSVLTGLVLGYGERLGEEMPRREACLAALAVKDRRWVCRMLGVSFRAAPQEDAMLLRMLQKRLQAPVQSADDCERLRQDEVPDVATLRVLLQEYLHWESFLWQAGELRDDGFLRWLCPKRDFRSGRYQEACRQLLQAGRELEEEKSQKTFECRELAALKDYLLQMELPTDFSVAEYVHADEEQDSDPAREITLPSVSWHELPRAPAQTLPPIGP